MNDPGKASPEGALHALIVSLFPVCDELRVLVLGLPEGHDLQANLPQGSTTPSTFSAAVVTAVQGRGQTREFLEAVALQRPGREKEIAAVAAAFGIRLSAVSSPSRGDVTAPPPAVYVRAAVVGASVGLAVVLSFRYAPSPASAVSILLGAATIAALARPRWSSRGVPELKQAGALQLRPRSPESLLGRDDDLYRLERHCHHADTVLLVGESGAGKSSLLRAGLVPLQRTSRNFVALFVDRWLKDWDEGLTQGVASAVIAAVRTIRSDELLAQRALPDDVSIRRAPFDAVSELSAAAGVPCLLIFDQFERYLTEHAEILWRRKDRHILNPDEVVAHNSAWRRLAQLVAGGKVKLLISVPSEFAFALESFRFGISESYYLNRISYNDADDFLRRLGDPWRDLSGGRGPAIHNARLGWNQLARVLLEDLSGKTNSILPQQLYMALQGLQTLRELTERAYIQAGGLRGLEARVIRTAVDGTSQAQGVSQGAVLAVLVSFVDLSNLTSRSLTASEVLDVVSRDERARHERLDVACVRRVLEHLDAQCQLVRRRTALDRAGASWLLRHDYLCESIIRVYQESARTFFELRARHQEFRRNPSRGRYWFSLLSLSLQVRLWWDRLLGRLYFGEHRAYVLGSAIRWLPYLAVYSLVVDYGAELPGGDAVRSAIDHGGISVFRTVRGADEIRGDCETLVREIGRTLLGGLEKEERLVFWGLETWAIGQTAYALSRGPLSQPELESVSAMLHELDEPELLARREGMPYAWRRTVRNNAMFALPALWIGAAAARLAFVVEGEPGEANRDLVDASLESRRHFQVQGTGAMSFYPRQLPFSPDSPAPDQHNSLATAMEVLFLLEARAAHAGAPSPDIDRDLTEVVHWLVARHRPDEAGWVSYPMRAQDVSRTALGLSLQIYATLIRAHLEADVPLPDAIFEGAARRITQLEGVHLPDRPNEVDENGGVYLDHEDRAVEEEILVTYAWGPWAISTASLLLRSPQAQGVIGRLGRRRVQRVLGELVRAPMDIVKWQREELSWLGAELYIGAVDCVEMR